MAGCVDAALGSAPRSGSGPACSSCFQVPPYFFTLRTLSATANAIAGDFSPQFAESLCAPDSDAAPPAAACVPRPVPGIVVTPAVSQPSDTSQAHARDAEHQLAATLGAARRHVRHARIRRLTDSYATVGSWLESAASVHMRQNRHEITHNWGAAVYPPDV